MFCGAVLVFLRTIGLTSRYSWLGLSYGRNVVISGCLGRLLLRLGGVLRRAQQDQHGHE